MPTIHVRPRHMRNVKPFVVGMGQIDFGATRIPTGGTREISTVPAPKVQYGTAMPGYVVGGGTAPIPPRQGLFTPYNAVVGGPSVLGANKTPLPTGFMRLDSSMGSARTSASTPSETSSSGPGTVHGTDPMSSGGMPADVVTDGNGNVAPDGSLPGDKGAASVNGTVEVPPTGAAMEATVAASTFALPFGLKWWHLGVAGGLAVGAIILMKRRRK